MVMNINEGIPMLCPPLVGVFQHLSKYYCVYSRLGVFGF